MRAKLYQGLGQFESFFRRLYSRELRVLAYHEVPDQKLFDEQVQYLQKNYDIISVDQLHDHLYAGSSLPENPLLMTFDDGDITVYDNALPVLKKYGVTSCLFIITGLINTDEDVWIKRIEAKEMKDGKTYREARDTVKRMKELSNKERLKEMEKFPHTSRPQLSTVQLSELQSAGVFIANHTHTHPMLDKCSAEEVRKEFLLARKTLEELGFRGYDVFAYPNGNVNNPAEKVLKELGTKLVFLFDHKINSKHLNPLRISRIKVDADTEINEFKAKVSGVHPFFFGIKKRFHD